ncbi:MAG: sigma-70 family RNA polymerase sigma factor [Planctomycetota bacterium]
MNELLRAEQDVWYRYAVSILRRRDAACDATQETGLRFIREIARFDGRSSVRTWGLGIALNVCREMQRRVPFTNHDAAEPVDRQPAPAAVADTAEQIDAVRLAVLHLSDRQREAVVLRHFEQLSVRDTAAVMGCAEGTVKATLSQAMSNLKLKLGAFE